MKRTGKTKTQPFSKGELDEVGFDETGDVIHAYETSQRPTTSRVTISAAALFGKSKSKSK